MIDFDTIEEKLTFDQQDLFFNEKELAKITNVLRHAFISSKAYLILLPKIICVVYINVML